MNAPAMSLGSSALCVVGLQMNVCHGRIEHRYLVRRIDDGLVDSSEIIRSDQRRNQAHAARIPQSAGRVDAAGINVDRHIRTAVGRRGAYIYEVLRVEHRAEISNTIAGAEQRTDGAVSPALRSTGISMDIDESVAVAVPCSGIDVQQLLPIEHRAEIADTIAGTKQRTDGAIRISQRSAGIG